MGFQERLKSERLKKKLKQRELADRIKSSNTSISNWESGTSQPTASVILLLSKALEISPFDLLGDYPLRKIQELDRAEVSELSYEDTVALKLAKDYIYETSNHLGQTLMIVAEDLDKNIKEFGKAIVNAVEQKLLGNGGEQLLLSYHCLNNSGKVLIIDYLVGLLRVPTYVDETEAMGIEQEKIDDLLKLKGTLSGGL